MWHETWERFCPFLDFDAEIRRVVYTTNMIESLNSRFRQATQRRGHFPTGRAALKGVLSRCQREAQSLARTDRASRGKALG
jgi:transposase-like protein